MGGVPGPTPWAIWKKRIAIFLIGPMLVMSGAIVALGGHDPIPDVVNPSASPVIVQPGQTAVHTFEVDNDSSTQRFEFLVTNTNDADFTYVIVRSSSGAALTDTDGDGTVNSTIEAHSQVEFQLRVTADPNAPFLSETTTSVRVVGDSDGIPSNIVTFVTSVAEGGPVTFDKSSDDPEGRVLVGQVVAYTIDFANPYSTQTITDFMVTDTLDSDFTLDTTSISGAGVYDSTTHQIVWSLGDLAPSATGTLTYSGTVEVVADQTQIVNTAVGDGSNVAAATDSVTLVVDAPTLSLFDKSVDDASPRPGDTITYSIDFAVTGSADLNNFTVTDTYDPTAVDVTQISPAPTSHDSVNGVIVWDLGTVTTGTSGTLFITATVVGADEQTAVNTAVATGDEIPQATSSATFTVNAEADLSIDKVDLTDPVKAGDTLTYRVTVTNAGPNPAEDTLVADDLPTGFTFVSSTETSCVATAEGFECGLGSVPSSSVTVFDVVVQVDPGIATGTVLTNTVTVTSPTDDLNLADNLDTEDTTVIEESNLVVTKSDGQTSVSAGTGPYTYTITIHNEGPSDAEVTLTDDWPSAFERTGLSCTPTTGTVTGTGDFTCDLGTLGPGATFTVTTTYVVPSDTGPGIYTNTATVTPVDSETDTSDNVAPDSTTVTREFDLIVSKSDGPVAPVAGDGVEYQYNIQIFNSGPSDALNVTLTDDWPQGFFRTGVNCSVSSGLAVGTGDFSCDLGTIEAGTTRTVVATYTVPATTPSGVQTNTVTATATGETNPSNNSAFDETFVSELTSLIVNKTDGQTEVAAGTGPYTYTITVFNEGPSEALLVGVTDDWPSELNRTAVSGCTGASLGTGDFTCTIASIGPGVTATVTVTFNVPSSVTGGLVTNTVTATSASDSSPNSDSDSTLVVEETDLEVVKTGPAVVVAGTGGYTYTITVFNAGPSDATDVILSDAWPSEFDRTTVSGCTGASLGTGDFTCSIASIPVGTTATVTVTLDVSSGIEAVTVTNAVTATSSTESDPSDNSDAFATEIVEETDLEVVKTGPAQVVAGTGGYTYTITIFNAGPSDAYDVTITDGWPAEFTRTGVTGCTGASLGTGDFTCSIASIPVGTTATVTVTFDAAADIDAATVTNAVTATSTSETDPLDNSDGFSTEIVEQTDLIVTKDDGVTTLVAGDGSIQTFTITVFNAGPSDADNVTLTDVWPSGYLRLDASGSCSNPTGTGPFTCALGTIAPGTTSTVTATYTVPATTPEGDYTNTATVVASPDTDTNPSDNTDSDTNTVGEASDLVVTKDDGQTSVVAGTGPYTYTITVLNAGPSDARDVTLTDVFPDGFDRDTVTGCTPDTSSDDFTCTLGTIAAGTTATVTVDYTVPSATPAGTYTNTASATTTATDADLTNNTDSDDTSVTEEADLVVTKDDGQTSVVAGTGPYTYTITVMNAGPSDARDVTLTDVFPDGFDRTSVTGCTPDTSSDDFTCTLGTIAAGTTATVTVEYTVPSATPAGTYTNTATVTTTATDPNPANNTDSDDTLAVEQANLVVTKDDGVTTLVAGDGSVQTFTITVFNAGPSDADAVTLTDIWPSGYLRLDASATCSNPTGTGPFSCSLGTIAAGTTATVTATYTVPSSTEAGDYTNTASATTTAETDPGDNTDSDTNTIVEETDLVVDKTGPAQVTAGTTGHTYTITVFNSGPSDAYDVLVNDTWPSEFTRTGVTGCTAITDPTGTGDFTCTIESIPAGTTATVVVTFDVASDIRAQTVTNTVVATSSTETDPLDNTDDFATVIVEETDLVVDKTGPAQVTAGTTGHTYTITVFNSGPSDAYDVLVNDTWPSEFTRTGVTGCTAITDPTGTGDFTCTIESISAGTTATVVVTFDVASDIRAQTVTNTVVATSSTETDPLDNTDDFATVILEETDLVVDKDDGVDTLVAGDGSVQTFSITVTNAGPSDAYDVSLQDEWPSGYVRLSASPICDDQSGTGPFTCTLGTIVAGETVVVTATYEVPSDTRAGSYTNTVTVTASPNTETNPSDNTDSDTNPVVEETDLVVTKDDGLTEVVAGTGPYTYTMTVFNAGPSDAFDVTLTDEWPSQFERTGVSCTLGSGAATGTAGFECSLGTIPAGTTLTVTATYTVPASIPDGPVTNTVTATSSTETEPTDNTASEVNNVITRADLVVVKTDAPDPAAVLTGITYTVTVTNQGPSDANQVIVVDDLDERTTYVTHTAGDVCTLAAGNDVISCDLGLMQPGSSFSFEIEVSLGILPEGAIVSNTVTATSSTTDPDPDNNAFVATTTVSAPVMTLTKTASPPSGSEVGPGQRIDYTITYRNTGSLTGSNFVITDTVAAQFGLPTVQDGGTYDETTRTITWTIGSVDPGEAGTVRFSASLGASDQRLFIDNVATATVTEMEDVISSNQTRHTLVPPDVLITKSANLPENSDVRALQVITYILRVSNRGSVNAIGVSVTDDPPAGMTYVPGSTRLDGASVSDSGGTSALFGPGVSLGTLGRGQERSITFDMQVRHDVRPGQVLENWGFVRWNFGLQVSGDFHHLRVLSRLSPPTLRMSILLQTAEGETLFVTVFNRVVGLLTVTGYEAALLLLLALAALGIGRNLTRDISPNLLRRMRE